MAKAGHMIGEATVVFDKQARLTEVPAHIQEAIDWPLEVKHLEGIINPAQVDHPLQPVQEMLIIDRVLRENYQTPPLASKDTGFDLDAMNERIYQRYRELAITWEHCCERMKSHEQLKSLRDRFADLYPDHFAQYHEAIGQPKNLAQRAHMRVSLALGR